MNISVGVGETPFVNIATIPQGTLFFSETGYYCMRLCDKYIEFNRHSPKDTIVISLSPKNTTRGRVLPNAIITLEQKV